MTSDYKDIKLTSHEVVHVICFATGEVLKDAKDMSRHFPEGNECTARHDFVAESEKPN